MFLGFLFWMFFLFSSVVLADDVSISWKSIPSSALMNTQFDLQVRVIGVAGTTYYLRADDGTDCTMEQLKTSNNSWSNSCNVGIAEMQAMTLDSSGSGDEILRLREISSSGSKTLYGYVYDSSRTLLATSASGSITINAATPTPTITSTPTSTPTLAVTSTPTPTPTKKTTPTPILTPVIEPTAAVEATVTPVTAETVVDLTVSSDNSKKSFNGYLPFAFVILGLIMFVGPVWGPKIWAKIKAGKRQGPPPFTPPSDTSIQPTSVREVTSDGEDIQS